jgi:hypothetical protein
MTNMFIRSVINSTETKWDWNLVCDISVPILFKSFAMTILPQQKHVKFLPDLFVDLEENY